MDGRECTDCGVGTFQDKSFHTDNTCTDCSGKDTVQTVNIQLKIILIVSFYCYRSICCNWHLTHYRFFIFKDAGVTIARTTNDSGAVAESECGWLSFVLI